MTKNNARTIADRYFKMQCERLGPIDHKLYNQAADLIVNEMLADAAFAAAGKKRKPPQHVQNRMSATDLAKFMLAHEANHARGDLKPRTLDEVYGDLKRGKK